MILLTIINKLLKLYIWMTSPLNATGRELNATFLPASLLRKSENKLLASFSSKCMPQKHLDEF